MKNVLISVLCLCAASAAAETRSVFLEAGDGARIQIATVDLEADGTYSVVMDEGNFTDHFLSMRPFKCLEGPQKHWCHVPYPYPIRRDVSGELTDLEYDFLFVWKGATEYGINLWNGVYYRMEETGDRIEGRVFEMDMNLLAAPPAAGDFRPIAGKDLHEGDADSHWLPRLVIE